MKAFGGYFSIGYPKQESEFITCAQRLTGSFKGGMQILSLPDKCQTPLGENGICGLVCLHSH